MRYVNLGNSGLTSSVLGFGCASVMGRAGRKQSLRALSAAYDSGITFFDTARSYGYGESERLLGEFLRSKRDRVILSTKFGILPAPQQLWKQLARPVMRTVVDVVPASRRMMQGFVRTQFQQDQANVAVLSRSLEESLRKLRTSYVDILFIHSAPVSVLAQEDLLESLEKLIAAGKIRLAGISAGPEIVRTALAARRGALKAMQFPTNVFDMSLMNEIGLANNRGLIFVANQPFGGFDQVSKSRRWLDEVATLSAVPRSLRDKLQPNDNNLLAEAVLNLILQDTGIHVAVTSMIKLDHLEANARAIAECRFTKEELRWLRRQLTEPAENSLAHCL